MVNVPSVRTSEPMRVETPVASVPFCRSEKSSSNVYVVFGASVLAGSSRLVELGARESSVKAVPLALEMKKKPSPNDAAGFGVNELNPMVKELPVFRPFRALKDEAVSAGIAEVKASPV